MRFSECLKQAMKEADMSQSALSVATGIGKSSISQYLSGKNEPTDERKAQIALALGFSPDYFEDAEGPGFNGANLPVMIAAKLMGKSKEFVYQGLREGVFPWGYAVQMGKNWNYYISPAAFTEHTGLAIN